MKNKKDVGPQSPERLQSFVNFFKGYMSLSSVVTAALPIPVTAFKLIPTYSAQTGVLSVYTSLFCFLILGFIFYSRHRLARLMFPEHLDGAPPPHGMFARYTSRAFIKFLPLLLIVLSIGFAFAYQHYWSVSVHERRFDIAQRTESLKRQANLEQQPELSVRSEPTPGVVVLEEVEDKEVLASKGDFIPYATLLMLLYIGIFVSAEASFILMAIKEYLQDLVGLTEQDLIHGPHVAKDVPEG